MESMILKTSSFEKTIGFDLKSLHLGMESIRCFFEKIDKKKLIEA